jgi:type IV pilus assembly protein PilQ
MNLTQQLRALSRWLFVAVAIAAPLADVNAQNVIESIASTQQGPKVVLRVTMKETLEAVPANFSVSQPARIAFDFPQTINATGRPSQEMNRGDLRSVTLAQVGNRTRLVLNLTSLPIYEAKVDGRHLVIELAPNPAAQTAGRRTGESERFGTERTAVDQSINDIDFRRGPSGDARIIVELSDPRTAVDVRQQGPHLIVEFMRTKLPENLRRKLNVLDFGTPVQSVNTFPQGSNTRMVIEPRGLWEHNAYQTDKQFVVEVKPIEYDPNKLVQGSRSGYKGEKLSLNFQSIDVRSILNVIADFTDLNIITSDTVQGSLTLRLKDVPWDHALDIIMQTRGLDMRKNGNVIWIAPRDELATKEKLELEARQQISDLEPLRTETFQLSYAKAEDIAKIIGNEKQRILSKRGNAVVDVRTNQLFVQDIANNLDQVRRIIAKADVPVRQVMIEARIVEADDRFSRTLGARLGFRAQNASNPSVQHGGSISDTGYMTGQIADPIPDFLRQGTAVNLPGSTTDTGAQVGAYGLTLFNAARTRFLNLEISALESDRKGKVISSPRVITADKTEASIEQGEEIPYLQATSSGASSIAFRKAVLSLKVKPQITPDSNVIMDVQVNKDSRGVQTSGGPAIDTKNVKTSVLVENGGTVVIGGIYVQDEGVTINKIPFFGDLPGIGVLFRNNLKSDSKRELLVFITPRIVDDRLSIR